MKKYFVAKEGIQKGPWTLEEITRNISNKILTWNDYIYDDKISTWLFLFEYPALTETFNSSFKKPVQLQEKTSHLIDVFKDRIWYILKQNENYGPFCTTEMIQMLQSKTLFEFDFVWRQDQSAWRRLSEISEFKPEKIKEIYNILKVVTDKPVDPKSASAFYRRRHVRADYKCELLVHNKQKVYSAESIEISLGGASFKIDNVHFELDSEVYLHFKPGGDVPPFNATCKVVSKNGNKYGVSFLTVSNTIKDQIEKFTKKAA